MKSVIQTQYDTTQTETPQQRFTGYWIPIELSKLGLTRIEQFLLAMIDSLEQDAPVYCFASNKYLAEHMELSESRVSFYITKFKKMGLVEEVGFDGRRRRIRTLKSNWYRITEENSKKELCVKTRSLSARGHVGSMRENTIHIEKKDTIDISPPPLPPPKPKAIKTPRGEAIRADILLRAEEEEKTQKLLENTVLSPKDRKRLSKEYTPEQVTRALEISKTQTVKKTLMGLLLNILDNPDDWPDASNSQLQTDQHRIALEYNQTLMNSKKLAREPLMKPGSKTFESQKAVDIAKRNTKSIVENYMEIILDGILTRISLKSPDFYQDIKRALAQLR